MVVPPKHPKMIIFSRKTHGLVGETHHLRKHPYKHLLNQNQNNLLRKRRSQKCLHFFNTSQDQLQLCHEFMCQRLQAGATKLRDRPPVDPRLTESSWVFFWGQKDTVFGWLWNHRCWWFRGQMRKSVWCTMKLLYRVYIHVCIWLFSNLLLHKLL